MEQNKKHDNGQPWREPRSTARTTTQPEMIMGDIDTNDDDFFLNIFLIYSTSSSFIVTHESCGNPCSIGTRNWNFQL